MTKKLLEHTIQNMAQFYALSKKKAEAFSSGVFLIALGVLFYLNAWWPGIILAIWSFLATRQFLTGRHFDMTVTTFILVGLFIVITFQISWAVLGPLLFMVGGAYIIFREYYYNRESDWQQTQRRENFPTEPPRDPISRAPTSRDNEEL